ncbi:hypothetical protein MNQ98_12660 [Paenibacillus sp. N3/727]|uniref:hypothetical protein n=1 Tax=Paenibacillus sp. N3/727 TaxID=2925845 RepID=UPI001F52D604|nr:hypothetical protein [Paenibacillus sp. N3/727]UNK20803.1 hypothetical protein MNQ98_12660 [Paenibacillus sp. N3/727]
MNSRSKKEWEALFNTQAMLDAYFSFQEHILILLLPFSQFNKDEDNITNLIGSDWTTKFNRIFKPQQNPMVMKFYDYIRGIKELRNKYAHGGFEKKKGSLLAHVPTLGAIPVELPQHNERGYSMIPIGDVDFTKICKVFDEFDMHLQNSEWSRAIRILEAGIDIRYDGEFMEQLNIATQSDESLNSFLQIESDEYARNANMDW